MEPVLWHINDDPHDAPPAELLVTERPLDMARRSRVSRIQGLRHVHLLSVGYEWVLDHLPPAVTLSNSRGTVEDSTAEHAMALVLAALRGLPESAQLQGRQEWAPLWTTSLLGSVVLVVGHGGVGKALTDRLAPFRPAAVIPVASRARTLPDGRHVHAADELPDLLPTADVVVVTLPHTEETAQLVDTGFLARMKDGALLVNVGRGAVVDTGALLAELSASRLRAALDVTDPEPLPSGHPLWSAPGCLITPHIAGNTSEFQRLATELTVGQVRRMVQGQELLHMVR